jgi:hypothetical protein
MINFKDVRTLEGGYSIDLTDNIEKKNTYQKGIGGRLYSKNGVVSFSGGAGTKLIYENINIVKYIGSHSFKDEILVFAKCIKGTSLGGSTQTVYKTIINANSFTISNPSTTNAPVAIINELSDNSSIEETSYQEFLPPINPTNFEENFTCLDDNIVNVNLDDYYSENANVSNKTVCSLNLDEIPVNNIDYDDCLITLKYDDNQNLSGTLRWVGWQNWPINGKITTEGVDENEFYKRVYYTDAINVRRVVNLKDSKLAYRLPNAKQRIAAARN